MQRDSRSEAIETLTELTAEGNHQYTLESLKQLADLTWREARYKEAASAYRKLYDVTTSAADHEAAMTGYMRSTLLADDPSLIAPMAEDVLSKADAGVEAQREARFAWAEQLRKAGDKEAAYGHYAHLASEVKSRAGSAAAYYLAKAYLLLGDIYMADGDAFQARATYQSIVDGYTPSDDGIVAEAESRIKAIPEQ